MAQTDKINGKLHLGTGANPVRLSYVTLMEPSAVEEGQDKKFSVSVLIPKTDTVLITKIKKLIAELVKEKWSSKKPAKLDNPLRDGDELDDEGERIRGSEYAGHYYLSCKAKKRPTCVTQKKEIIDLDNLEEQIYSGCYAIVSVNFYTFEKAANKGVGVGLNAIQKVKEGEMLGDGFTYADDEFGELEIADEYDDLDYLN